MAEAPEPWGICGGWALDLFLDRRTRDHKDVEVAVLRRDQLLVQNMLEAHGWKLEIATDGTLTPWEHGHYLQPPLHTIWCSSESDELEFFEVLLNEHEGSDFVFRRNSAVKLPLKYAFIYSPADIPILAHEIVLLYMATEDNALDRAPDLVHTLPDLTERQRQLLQDAIKTIDEERSWLNILETYESGT